MSNQSSVVSCLREQRENTLDDTRTVVGCCHADFHHCVSVEESHPFAYWYFCANTIYTTVTVDTIYIVVKSPNYASFLMVKSICI